MTKAEIRIQYKQKRRKLSVEEKDKLEDLMLIQFQKLVLYENSSILTYAPIKVQNEYDPYLAECFCMFKNRGAHFSFPVIDTDTDTMKVYEVDSNTVFKQNAYGIAEPKDATLVQPSTIEMIFVPLIAFSTNGYRVGYGKGYYDKFIKLCEANVVKVGFSFFEPVAIDDIHEEDEKLDFCITANQIFTF